MVIINGHHAAGRRNAVCCNSRGTIVFAKIGAFISFPLSNKLATGYFFFNLYLFTFSYNSQKKYHPFLIQQWSGPSGSSRLPEASARFQDAGSWILKIRRAQLGIAVRSGLVITCKNRTVLMDRTYPNIP